MDLQYSTSDELRAWGHDWEEAFETQVLRCLDSLYMKGWLDEETETLHMPVADPIYVFSSRVILRGVQRRIVCLVTTDDDNQPKILVCSEKEAKRINPEWEPQPLVKLPPELEKHLGDMGHAGEN